MQFNRLHFVFVILTTFRFSFIRLLSPVIVIVVNERTRAHALTIKGFAQSKKTVHFTKSAKNIENSKINKINWLI